MIMPSHPSTLSHLHPITHTNTNKYAYTHQGAIVVSQLHSQHNNFRQSWNVLWQACTTGRRPQGMSIKQLLQIGTQFAEHLTVHHSIEETYVFPQLARRMPEFDPKNGDLVKQHAQIHDGLEEFEKYLAQVKSGERDFELSVLKEKMESWGGVLWTHLDDEVRSLGAENMRKYWTMEEIRRLQM